MKKFLFLIFLIIFLALFGLVKETKAGLSHNLCGWAWADPETIWPGGDPVTSPPTNLDIGWISFNNLNCDGTTRTLVDFGVNVDLSTGKFSGHAWSGGGDGTDPNQGVGWISFERTETGPPPYDDPCPDGSCIAKLNLADNTVSGWARACGTPPGGVFQCGGGGWDGWIKLRGTGYGVSRDTAPSPDELTGWAWAGDVTPDAGNALGWIKFHRVFFRSQPPSATALRCREDTGNLADPLCYIDPCFDARHPRLSWNYSDGIQAAYQIQISQWTSPAWGVSDLILDKTVDPGPSSSYTVTASDLASDLSYNKSYSWRVKVKNDAGTWSDWSNTSNFTTYLHAWPSANFACQGQDDCSIVSISEGEIMTLEDISTFYNGFSSRLWTLPPGATLVSGGSTDPLIEVKIPQGNNQPITLEVTDADGYSCATTEYLDVSAPLPEWREIPPTGWILLPKLVFQNLGKFLNSILGFLI